MIKSIKIIRHFNDKTKKVEIVDKIPGDETNIVFFSGGGIFEIEDADKAAANVFDEVLSDVADIPNYALFYYGVTKDEDSLFKADERVLFERHDKNFLPKDKSMLYISDRNINMVFRQKVIPLLSMSGAKAFNTLNFIVDGDTKEYKGIIKQKLKECTKDMNFSYDDMRSMLLHISEHVFSYSKYFDPEYLDDLFASILLPRITDENGARLPLKTALQRIRKINIFAHCYGAYVALRLEERMQNKMRELGYSQSEMNQIQSELLVVALNPASPLGVSKSTFISFISGYDDKVMRADNWVSEFVNNNRQSELKQINESLRPIRWNLKPGFLSGQDGNVFFIKQRFDLIPDGQGGKGIGWNEHNNMHYVSKKFTNDGKMLATFAHNILVSGIKNSLAQTDEFIPLPALEKLFLDGQNDEKLTAEFEQMKQNGKDFMTDVYKYAINRVRAKIPRGLPNNDYLTKKR